MEFLFSINASPHFADYPFQIPLGVVYMKLCNGSTDTPVRTRVEERGRIKSSGNITMTTEQRNVLHDIGAKLPMANHCQLK